jgi:hypothetical protein
MTAASPPAAAVPAAGPAGDPCGRVFATRSWAQAWERFTVEPGGPAEVVHDRDGIVCATRVLHRSPFWTGYEQDARMPPIWRGPFACLSSVYAVSNPLNQLPPGTAAQVVDAAVARFAGGEVEALLVTNLEPGPVLDAVRARRAPDALVRLDATNRLTLPAAMDEYLAALRKPIRTELRRLHRRATERGVRLRTSTGEQARGLMPEYVALTTASAQKHDITPLYDVPTLQALTEVPGMRLYSAERDGELLAGIIAFAHGPALMLWSGGIRYSALREYSPYLFLLHELISAAIGEGLSRLDFGRGNVTFKGRYGFTPTDLWTAVYLPDGPRRHAYREQLARMHAGIDAFLAAA